jgi:hypothetical protein
MPSSQLGAGGEILAAPGMNQEQMGRWIGVVGRFRGLLSVPAPTLAVGVHASVPPGRGDGPPLDDRGRPGRSSGCGGQHHREPGCRRSDLGASNRGVLHRTPAPAAVDLVLVVAAKLSVRRGWRRPKPAATARLLRPGRRCHACTRKGLEALDILEPFSGEQPRLWQ